jgi:site-specific DNA recombinase
LVQHLRTMFRQPEIIARTWKAARTDDASITEVDATEALRRLDPLWDELFPVDQARIVGLLVELVEVGEEGLNVQIRVDGLGGLARDLLSKVGDAVCNGSVFINL